MNNPFTSKIFSSVWAKHFNQSVPGVRFPFIKELLFAKHRLLPFYFNYGKTHTKGIGYGINEYEPKDIKGKVLLIYDVPTFFGLPNIHQVRLKQHKIKQYPGFLINLSPFQDLNTYMAANFNKSSRYKLKKYKKKLETCFEIKCKMFYGETSKAEYEHIFSSFKNLLVKRFDDKQTTNNNLEKQEWDFYHEVAFTMILEKKAGLFVIYNDDKPIAVTLCYFSKDILFDAITVFDIDYAKFHLGSVNIMKLLEWCLEHNFDTFDFSKGDFDYKRRWATMQYDFEYHLLYDSKSIKARWLALVLKYFFTLKQFLREKNINEKVHKLVFFLKKRNIKNKPNLNYRFQEVEQDQQKESLIKVDWKDDDFHFLRVTLFEYLYLNEVHEKTITIYKDNDRERKYTIVSPTAKTDLIFY